MSELKPLSKIELTLIEASFVTATIAQKEGMSKEQWLSFAAKVWDRLMELERTAI